MVRAPRFQPEEERRGRRNALLHPFERRRVLEACDRAVGKRINRRAEVLIWGDRAWVHEVGYFNAHREPDGAWTAEGPIFF